jgi:hypothetical protein
MCVVCNSPCQNTLSCGCRLHLECLQHSQTCPSCSAELTFTSAQWDIIHGNDELSTSEDDDSEEALDNIDISEIIDQLSTPEHLTHRRIEHKVISVDENGKPKVVIVSIPRKYTNSYMNRMFGVIRTSEQVRRIPTPDPSEAMSGVGMSETTEIAV